MDHLQTIYWFQITKKYQRACIQQVFLQCSLCAHMSKGSIQVKSILWNTLPQVTSNFLHFLLNTTLSKLEVIFLTYKMEIDVTIVLTVVRIKECKAAVRIKEWTYVKYGEYCLAHTNCCTNAIIMCKSSFCGSWKIKTWIRQGSCSQGVYNLESKSQYKL